MLAQIIDNTADLTVILSQIKLLVKECGQKRHSELHYFREVSENYGTAGTFFEKTK